MFLLSHCLAGFMPVRHAASGKTANLNSGTTGIEVWRARSLACVHEEEAIVCVLCVLRCVFSVPADLHGGVPWPGQSRVGLGHMVP